MNIILLSGGSGKRLWPLSNDIRSKQFINIFRKEDGEYESMVQRIYRQIKSVDENAVVTIATAKNQISSIHKHLGEDVSISVEPCRRDTFPAIVLAVSYLHDVLAVSEQEAVVICPVDPYVDDEYFAKIRELWQLAQDDAANLVLMGISPTYPSEKYGYIIPKTSDDISKVVTFKEKPDATTAQSYIDSGGLWNGGVFACKISYVLEKAHQIIDFVGYEDLYEKYASLNKISFDYAVVEHEKDISVLRFNGQWKDIGTWNTFTEVMQGTSVGNVIMGDNCERSHVINELDIPVLAMGIQNIVVAASPEGILVSDKGQSSYIKPYVDSIDQQVMYAEKSWGTYRVIDVGENSLTIKVILNPGSKMNYHSHDRRNEIWNVVSGTGKAIIDGTEKELKEGDVLSIPIGVKHTVIAQTELTIIEIQMGKDISVSDKHKYDYTWQKNIIKVD